MHYNFPHVYKSRIFGQLFLLNICENQLNLGIMHYNCNIARQKKKVNTISATNLLEK